MVPVTMIAGGVVLGIWSRSRARAHRWLVTAFLIVLVIQTAVVLGPGHGSSTPAYWLVQAASLVAGLLLLNGTAAVKRWTATRRADQAA